MSVRNILDGTIPVGGSGGLTPESDIEVNHVYSNLGFHTPGSIEGTKMFITEELRVPQINAGNIAIYTQSDDREPSTKIAGESISTPSLTLGGSEVLKMTKSSGSRVIVGTLASSGNQMTFSATGSSRILDITSEMHAVDIIATMKECVTMKSLTFNTGLKLEGRQTRVFGNTVCQIGEAYLDAYVDLYMENDYLMAKLTFKDTPEYTSMSIKINMIFY